MRGGWDREVPVEDVVGVVPCLELAELGQRVARESIVQSVGSLVGLEAGVEAVEVRAQFVPVTDELACRYLSPRA